MGERKVGPRQALVYPRKHDFVRLVGISGLPEDLCIFDGYHADDVESCEISWGHDNVVRSVAVGLG